jgi:hypothetical protein
MIFNLKNNLKMSKVVVIFEMPGFTAAQYNTMLQELKAQGKLLDEKRPSHVAFQKGENWCVIDIWDSQEEMMESAQSTLFPIFEKLGITPAPPTFYPAHNYIGSVIEEHVEA